MALQTSSKAFGCGRPDGASFGADGRIGASAGGLLLPVRAAFRPAPAANGLGVDLPDAIGNEIPRASIRVVGVAKSQLKCMAKSVNIFNIHMFIVDLKQRNNFFHQVFQVPLHNKTSSLEDNM